MPARPAAARRRRGAGGKDDVLDAEFEEVKDKDGKALIGPERAILGR